MKRTRIVTILFCMLCILVCGSFAGCSDSNDKSADPTKTQATISSSTEAAEATEAPQPVTDAQAETTADSNRSPLVGTWEYEEGGFSYTFNADGTGTYDVFGEVMNFAYTDNGDSFAMTFEDADAPTTLAYSIDGNTLTVKDSVGSDVKYIKK